MAKARSKSFEPVKRFRETRRNLPHHQEPGSAYFVTFRAVHGDMPPSARSIVLAACLFWNDRRYQLHACVVMPDHVHLLLTPTETRDATACHSLSRILHSIKSYTANEINKLLNRRGAFWTEESYDRIMRDDAEFLEKWRYIQNNPVTKELVQDPEHYPFLYQHEPA